MKIFQDTMPFLIYLLAALYIISPVDLLPELGLGRLGFVDDILLLGWLLWRWIYRPPAEKARAGESPEEEEEKRGRNPETAAKDPYATLGLAKGAGTEEVKRAYRELSNKYHPDKVNHLGEEFRTMAEKRFKEIKSAYEELSGK